MADDKIEPTLRFEEGRDEAILATPVVSATVDGANWKGSGEVLLARFPQPAIQIRCLFDSGVGSGPAGGMRSVSEQMAKLFVDGQEVAGFAAEATPRFDDDGVDGVQVLWRPRDLPVQGDGEKGTRMERIRFSLFNFDLPGEPHHNGTGFGHLLKLSDEEWSVTVVELMPRDEARKRTNKDGGVHLTHAGSVSRTDGADFTGAEARAALEMLEDFLAFASGRKTTACCPVGTVGADKVWSMWSPPERWEPGRESWLDCKRPQSLGELFPAFMAKRRSCGWGKVLGEAVYWYRIANDSARGIDAGLPCAQMALERLHYEFWKRDQPDPEAIGEKELRKLRKIGTAERVRRLLSKLDVPCEIPPRAECLRKAVEGSPSAPKDAATSASGSRKPPSAAKGSPSAPKDAATALADIRNDVVHGRRGRKDIPPQRFIEAWTLAMRIVEMAILSLCGYSGWHWNRISREPERVPWASRVAERKGKGEEAT